MSYIGLAPVTNFLSTFSERFSGNGSTRQFILERAVGRAEDLEVFVGSTQILPSEYTAVGTELTFDVAPTAGTDNITVIFRAGALQTIDLTNAGFPAGSAASPGVFNVNANNTGLFWPSSTSLGLSTSGVARLIISSSINSTSTTTGALQVAGGVGLTGNLYAGGIIRLTDETESAATADGALVVSGGVGIAKNLNVGGDIQVTGDFTVAGTFTTTASDSLAINDPFLFLATNNTGDALDTGFVSKYVDGALVDRYTGFFRDVTDGTYKIFANLTVEPSTTVDTTAPSFALADLSLGSLTASGVIAATSGTASSSRTTGAVVVTGGLGVSGAVHAASLELTAGAINTTGAIGNVSGVTSSGVIRTTGIVYANSNVASTTSTTGALRVIGGVGVNGAINASGNISASFYTGNGSLLTGIDATSIQNGSANVRTFNNANVTVSAGGVANVASFFTDGLNLASGDSYFINNTNVLSATALGTGVTASSLTSVGTIATGTWNATTIATNKGGTGLTSYTSGGALYATSTSALTTGTLPVASGGTGVTTSTGSGAVVLGTSPTFTTQITTPVIVKSGSTGVGNIGQSANTFNTVFARATSAQYADLAEKYTADRDYEPGTVVHFGGDYEVSQCNQDMCARVAGVVSTNPAYRMNDDLVAEHVAMVALTGRVPCKVVGPVAKGDMMVSAGNGRARAEDNPKLGSVIGKALENFSGSEGVIEVVVGRL